MSTARRHSCNKEFILKILHFSLYFANPQQQRYIFLFELFSNYSPQQKQHIGEYTSPHSINPPTSPQCKIRFVGGNLTLGISNWFQLDVYVYSIVIVRSRHTFGLQLGREFRGHPRTYCKACGNENQERLKPSPVSTELLHLLIFSSLILRYFMHIFYK